MSGTPPRILWSSGGADPVSGSRGPEDPLPWASLTSHAQVVRQAASANALPGDAPYLPLLPCDPRPRGLRGAVSWLINVTRSAARILQLRPDVVVLDQDTSAWLPSVLLGRRILWRGPQEPWVGRWVDGFVSAEDPEQAAQAILAQAKQARRGPKPDPSPAPRLLKAAVAMCVLGAVFTQIVLMSQQIIKVEEGNASQLATHALIRDGQIVLASDPTSYAEALHHLFFYPLLLLSPRLEVIVGFLSIQYALAALATGWLLLPHLGRAGAWIAGAMVLANPVSPILANHVISTALVPLFGAFYLRAVLDLARTDAPEALGRALFTFALLLALNVGHVWMALPIAHAAWRGGTSRIPARWVGLVGLALAPALFRRLWFLVHHGTWIDLHRWVIDPPHEGLWAWYRRMVLIEPDLHHIFPNLWLLLLMPAVGVAVTWQRRRQLPPGLVPMLAVAPLLALSNFEATVVWLLPMAAWFGWLGAHHTPSRLMVGAYLPSYPLVFGVGVATVGLPPGGFFALSLLSTRHETLDTLIDRFGMTSEEFETLKLTYPLPDSNFQDVLAPGLGYLVDRVYPPLPTGGSRCLEVAHPASDPPPGVDLLDTDERGGLVFRAWLPADTCDSSPRLTIPPVVVWDLNTGTVREVHP